MADSLDKLREALAEVRKEFGQDVRHRETINAVQRVEKSLGSTTAAGESPGKRSARMAAAGQSRTESPAASFDNPRLPNGELAGARGSGSDDGA